MVFSVAVLLQICKPRGFPRYSELSRCTRKSIMWVFKNLRHFLAAFDKQDKLRQAWKMLTSKCTSAGQWHVERRIYETTFRVKAWNAGTLWQTVGICAYLKLHTRKSLFSGDNIKVGPMSKRWLSQETGLRTYCFNVSLSQHTICQICTLTQVDQITVPELTYFSTVLWTQ